VTEKADAVAAICEWCSRAETGLMARPILRPYLGRRALAGAMGLLVPTIAAGPSDTASVALTFDDGPHPEITPRLLDVLARHGARATFFPLGCRVQRWPELVAQVGRAGHTVGSHGFTHRGDWWRSPRTLGEDLRRAEEAFGRLLAEPKLFRPPFGALSPSWALACRKQGYTLVFWSVVSYDWKDPDAGRVADRVMRGIRPGAIVLFHECHHRSGEGYRHTVEAVDCTLKSLASGGVRWVSVLDFLQVR
jgi:peptidoglycan/xylan/chitin deacetylase (PgdA/CDA1 family)